MLKIVMGSETVPQFMNEKKFIEFPNSFFDDIKKED